MMMFYDNVFKCLPILYVNIFVQSTELYGILGLQINLLLFNLLLFIIIIINYRTIFKYSSHTMK